MRKALQRFAGDRGGNFALMTSLMAVPLLLGVGMALDYSTISRARADLQNSLDAAVLSVAREGKDISDDKARQIAELFVAQNSRLKVFDIQVHHDGTAFSVTGVTNAPIAFGNLFGYDGWPVAAASSADIAYASYEVGLVLDTTGSMAGGKLSAMKDAVNGLIDSMSKQVNDTGKLKFALVPFSSFVNVGPGFGPSFDKGKQIAGTGAAWLDMKGASPLKQSELGTGASRFQLNANMGQKWSGCVETREASGNDYDVSDAPADPAKPETLFVPAFAIDEPDSGYINNYIGSGAKPNDPSVAQKIARWKKYGVQTDASGNPLNGGFMDATWARLNGLPLTGGSNPTIAISTHAVNGYGQTGPSFGCVSQPITALSSDYATLKTKVDALKAQGNTNIMEGVAWGMRVLSPGEPFSQGADPKKTPNLEKIMIVLTDGTNVFGNTGNALGSTYSSLGYLVDGRLGISAGGSSSTTPLMNDRTLAACNNAKAQGIEVYTIRLEEPNVATGTLLKECASVPENYFDVPSRSQLDDAFGKIKERIARVRISS